MLLPAGSGLLLGTPGSQESVGKEVSKYLDSGCTRLQLLGRPCLEWKASLVR